MLSCQHWQAHEKSLILSYTLRYQNWNNNMCNLACTERKFTVIEAYERTFSFITGFLKIQKDERGDAHWMEMESETRVRNPQGRGLGHHGADPGHQCPPLHRLPIPAAARSSGPPCKCECSVCITSLRKQREITVPGYMEGVRDIVLTLHRHSLNLGLI